MPIYEFYCPDCHTVYSFFTGRPRVDAAPACPRCARPDLERKPSRFATVRGRAGNESDLGGESGEGDLFAGLDESRLERAMDALMAETGGLAEGGDLDDDPRAVGRLMRRFGSLAGLELGERMEAMVARLEAGEDPEALEAEMGDLEGKDGGGDLEAFFRLKKATAGRRPPPAVDDELYFL